MKNIYDLSFIRNHGIGVLDHGYFWPVSENEFHEFSKYIFNEYQDLLLISNDDKLISIGLVETSFVNLLVQIFHCNYVKNYAKINNFDLTIPDFNDYLKPNWQEIGAQYKKYKFPHGKSVRLIRSIVKYFIFNSKRNILLNIFSRKGKCISIGSSSKLKEKFINNNNLCCSYYDFPDLFSNDLKSESNSLLVDKFEKEVINKLFDKIIQINSNFSLDFDFNEARLSWIRRFKDAAALYDSVKVPKKCKTLLITESAKPYHKIIINSMQKQGVHVYGFHHGNDTVAKISKQGFSANIAQCRNLVVPTDGIKARYDKHYSDTYRITNFSTKFISINSDTMYQEYLNNMSNKYNSDTVMIMGYPCECTRYSDCRGLFFKQQVDLEYQIISILKRKNKRVIYKAHPDRLREIKEVFNCIVDDILITPFEETWDKAGLLIFTYSETTTFGYALTTNLPIILLDSEEDMRDAHDIKLLDTRVIRIPTNISENTQINFNKERFVKAVNQKNYNISYKYIEEIYK